MKRVLVTGAGGAAAIGFTRSLQLAPERFYLIGVDSNKYNLVRAQTNERFLLPSADHPSYIPMLKQIIQESGVELAYAQTDYEIPVISRHRDIIGAKVFMPSHEAIETCLNKFESYKRWAQAGIKVPKTALLLTSDDLRSAMAKFGPKVWIREISGGAGKNSLPTDDFHQANSWIDFHRGWGKFSAAELLGTTSVTWQSIWWQGELVVAQSRKRLYWEFASRAPSGITGITGTGVTIKDSEIDDIAQHAILAIDRCPHGIFSVDLTYDREGIPNPTEINIGRFFTTHFFFTVAGLNMPYIYTKLGYGETPPQVSCKVNPLEAGLAWVRGMDTEPILVHLKEIDSADEELTRRLETQR